MKPEPLFPLTEDWSPAQKLAVYDFCRLLSETLWQQYEDELIDEMIRLDRTNGFAPLRDVDERNLELPFDDELSF
jgi:hypothetical protein